MTSSLSEPQLVEVAERLRRAGVELAGPLTCSRLSGGRSNLTFRLDDGASSFVLRTPPRAGRTPSAHDVVREYRVVSALSSTDVPVPAALVACEDEAVDGAPYAVARFVDGRTIQDRSELDELGQTELDQIVSQLLSTLTVLHAVEPNDVGLGDFGRPDGYAARQVGRWKSQWEIVGVRALDGVAAACFEALESSVPRHGGAAIVHGDYRIDNTILDLTDGVRVRAVVDWELSTLGDPVADVATMCAYRFPAFDHIVGAQAAWTSPRLPTPDSLAGMYEALGGAPLVGWRFHLALAHLKVAAIAAGIDHRAQLADTHEPESVQAGDAVEPFLQECLEILT